VDPLDPHFERDQLAAAERVGRLQGVALDQDRLQVDRALGDPGRGDELGR
jgi:hypothetical protein